nr:integrase, catalytic region, zinc finger, CCHC-type, peptidase aspartic, catalytic [Tanacetum cinerariifolium]
MASASPICLMARATPTKSWLWHQRLSHLNFDTINALAKNDLVSGLPKFKYAKEYLCPSMSREKAKEPLTHPNLFRIRSSGFICFIWICVVQCELQALMQNGVVERRNCTLVKAARTMLIFSHALLFLWAEAIATACYTQNHSIIHRRVNKTPYEFIQGRKPDISYLYVFRALCYPKNDREDIGKFGAKEAPRTVPVAPVIRNLQAPSASMSIQDSALTLTNSSNTPICSHNVNEQSPTAYATDDVSNAVFEGDLFVNPFATPSTESVVSST